MSKYINQLPKDVQNTIKHEAIVTLENTTDYSYETILVIVNTYVMDEKLINIIGCEEGLLSYDKYSKYL